MKTKLRIENLRVALVLLLLLTFSVNGYSQSCPGSELTYTISNVVQTPTTLEYDILVRNTSASNTIAVAAVAGNVRFPAGMLTSGNQTVVTQPSATGNFPGWPNLTVPAIVIANQQMRFTMSPVILSNAVQLPIGTDVLVTRLRVNNTGTPWSTDYTTALYWANGGSGINPVTLTAYCNGNTNSYTHSLALNNLVLVNPPSTTCFTSGTFTQTPATCATSSNGTATITMSPVPTDLNASYILGANASVPVVLTASGQFTISGLTPGSHTLSVLGSGICTTAVSVPLTITAGADIIPTFTQVGNICTGGTLNPLPTTSNNGITGSWSPALDNTATTTYTFTPDAGQCATTTTMTITVNASLVTPTFTQVSAICSGATLAALPTTSTNGITGSWSPALDNTTTTTYTFTSDAGQCAADTTMTITVTPTVTPTFAQVASICSGDSLATLPTTSTNGVTGVWSPAINNTTTTTYTFTPTAGQCATTASMTITVNPIVTPTFTQVAAICNGGTLAALPTASNNSITGTWTPALDNTATTTYTFTPAAGQCATTATMTITVNPNVTPTFTQVAAICNGGTLAALPTTSTNSIIGTWAPALNNTATTTYTFTPTAGQCATTATMTITVTPNVTPTFASIAALCQGATAPALPTSSTDATPITGTWNPSTIDTATPGTVVYIFTPDPGQCATTASMSVTINATTNTTTTISTCDSYTWAANGTTYTTSGIYVIPATLPSGIYNTLASWTGVATATSATVATNPLTAITAANPLVVPVGAVTATMTPGAGGMYSSGTFISTGNSNTSITINFSPAVYGVSGNYFVTDVFDAPIAGSITITYSDGTTETQPVSAATDFFGFYKSTSISSVVIAPVLTTPSVSRYVAIDNLRVATNPLPPACQTQTLDLTITPSTTTGSITTTACGSYTWPANGVTYTTSQTNLTHVVGCNTATLNLTITPNTTTGSITTTACDSYTWPANGVTYTSSQTNVTHVVGCNTATLNLTINNSTTGNTTATACGSYTWAGPLGNGQTYTSNQSGITFTSTNAAGCTHTQTLNLVINPLPATPTGSATQSFGVADLNDATVASLVVSPATVIWYPTEADALAATNPLATTTVLTNGATYWAVNAGTPCSSLPFAVTVTVTLGNEEFDNLSFSFYPNPTSSTLNISYSKVISEIQVSNMLGQVVMTKKTNGMDVLVDLSGLAEATYFVKVTSEGLEKIIKVIKRN